MIRAPQWAPACCGAGWVCRLLDLERLERRLDAVQFFFDDAFRRDDVAAALSDVADLERILTRIRTQNSPPRDLLALRKSLAATERLAPVLSGDHAAPVAWLAGDLRPLPDVSNLIDAAIADEPSAQPGDGGVIKAGFSPELDRIRAMASDARGFIASLEAKERERTGIRNLKVGFNQVFGYYIEVSRSNLDSVPDDYQRRQTLTGGERYITPELKEYESQALDARDRLEQLERTLYRQVCQQIGDHAESISRLAAAIARVDVFVGLAGVAVRHGYVRPILDDGNAISIVGGRHPGGGTGPGSLDEWWRRVRAQRCGVGLRRCPDHADYRPQHGGQVHVHPPGRHHRFDGPDWQFRSRHVGNNRPGGPNLHPRRFAGRPGHGAVHVHGRDGGNRRHTQPGHLALAGHPGRDWPGNQHLRRIVHSSGRGGASAQQPPVSCKTMFATHYHELTELAATLPGVRNYRVAVSEEDGRYRVPASHRARRRRPVIRGSRGDAGRDAALRREPRPGTADGAGAGATGPAAVQNRSKSPSPQLALPLFGSDDNALAESILGLDIGNLTPLEAINKLYELQEKARQA